MTDVCTRCGHAAHTGRCQHESRIAGQAMPAQLCRCYVGRLGNMPADARQAHTTDPRHAAGQ